LRLKGAVPEPQASPLKKNTLTEDVLHDWGGTPGLVSPGWVNPLISVAVTTLPRPIRPAGVQAN